MKKNALSLFCLISLSFLLSGLQGNLYFLPVAMPYFWFIIFTYYSFKKDLLFSLTANAIHVFVLSSFTSLSLSLLLTLLNLTGLVFFIIKERLHTTNLHITIASGAGCLFFIIANWSIKIFFNPFFTPNWTSWMGTFFTTLIVAPPLIFILDQIDHKIQFERIDTLENLRI